MRVSVYVQISLKDRDKQYLGRTGESLSIGKKEKAGMDDIVIGLLIRLLDYFCIFSTADELNAQFDRIAAYCTESRFLDVQKEEDHEAGS